MKKKVLFCWSGGKDSAFALYQLQQDPTVEITGLLTTINKTHLRVSMHGVHESLIKLQAKSIGLPLSIVYIEKATNEEYEQNMKLALENQKRRGVTHVAFGDIFLEDLKLYREKQTALVGLKCLFPLWGKNTSQLVQEFMRANFKTMLCCVNEKMGRKYAGEILTNELVKSFPEEVDPCGENGEFHSFVFEGPIFNESLKIENQGVVQKDYEWKNEEGKVQKSIFFFADIVSYS
jgi:uncharacterized protein (TIGR00290 family)